MRVLALAVIVSALAVSAASAQPQLSVSSTEVPGAGSVTVTVNATPGLYLAIVGSTRDSGLSYGGVNLQIGTDVQILFLGFVPATGAISLPFTPPLANGLDVYYVMAVTSASGDLVPPTPSATIALRQRGFYSFAPTFPHGLSAGGGRVTATAWPLAPDDAASKAYVDASQFRLGPAATQSTSTTTPLINTEQTGSGDLLTLRTNSTTYPGALGLNPNRVQFRVLPDGGFYARGQFGYGAVPLSGAGDRLMWAAHRVAFRAGGVTSGNWDDVSLGVYSWAGGLDTLASGQFSLAHGHATRATGNFGIALGQETRAMSTNTTAIGYRTGACASNSVAIGTRASTSSAPTDLDPCAGTAYSGALALGDASAGYLSSSFSNQFSARFAGGYNLYTNPTMTTGMRLSAGGSTWIQVSDRNAKRDIAPVDDTDILRRLLTVPISTFYYKDGDGQRYIGPMAQDFYAAFGLGGDDTSIRTMDVDGVSLASIRALARELEALKRDHERVSQENAELRRRLDAVLTRLEQVKH